MSKLDLIEIRSITDEDKPFIFSTWLKGLYYGNDFFRTIDKATYDKLYHNVIEQILEISSVKVACLKEDKDVVLGYAVHSTDGETLHWIFVKTPWRKMGIARLLLTGQNINTASHITAVGKTLLYKNQLTFNPFVLVKSDENAKGFNIYLI